MSSILPYVRDKVFDSEAIEVMSRAFDQARKALHDTGQPELVRQIIATRIVAFASDGERDPAKLAAAALHGIDQSRA